MSRDQRGAATAELALGIPLLVSLTIGLVWLLTIGSAQVRMIDAARETARAGARGDGTPAAVSRGEQVAPGAVVTLSTGAGRVVATASDVVTPPGGLLGFLPAVHVHAEAVAAAEAGAMAGAEP
ncbi:MAG TPA: TadE family protein [Nocardioides sp.]|uniref:TadE family protein n=1 Tax=Nocardioides sp. TaxID=35761 RepID=UPI002F41E1C1